jgi:ATP-dependent DNA helicase RecG
MVKEAIANGFLLENGQKPSEKGSQKGSNVTISDGEQTQKQPNLSVSEEKNGHKNGHEDDQKQPQKQPKLKTSKFPAPIVEEVYKAIKLNRKAKYSWLQDNLGVSEATIKRAIADLKELGYINKEHSKIKGEWQLLK